MSHRWSVDVARIETPHIDMVYDYHLLIDMVYDYHLLIDMVYD